MQWCGVRGAVKGLEVPPAPAGSTSRGTHRSGLVEGSWGLHSRLVPFRKKKKISLSRGDGRAGAWLCLGQGMWTGWDGDVQFSWQELGVRETQRGMETLRVLCVCLNSLSFASALAFKSYQNNPENLSIYFAVSARQGKWLDISLCDGREM